MLRFGLVLMAVALTAGALGCTHCDTCDDFPTPCVGFNCGYPGHPAPSGTYTAPSMGVVGPPAPAEAAPAPAPAPAPSSTGAPAPVPTTEPAITPPAAETIPAPGAETSPPAPMSPGSPFTTPKP
jgi:hypothetical protein